jgi:hypothetical protein
MPGEKFLTPGTGQNLERENKLGTNFRFMGFRFTSGFREMD